MLEIVPAILPKSFRELEEKTKFLIGTTDLYHLDISDGQFTPNVTWPYVGDGGEYAMLKDEFRGMPDWRHLDFEVHLMVKNASAVIFDWIKMGAVKIIIHTESTDNDTIHNLIEEWGNVVDFSLAIRFETPIENLLTCANNVRHIHLLTIENIGYQGQSLAQGALDKIIKTKEAFPNHIITIDGGVNLQNIASLKKAGADCVIAGSYVFQGGLPKEKLKKLQEALEDID